MNDLSQTQQFPTETCGEATQMAGSPQATQMSVTVTCPVCKTDNPPGDQYCLDCGFLLSSTPVETEVVAAEAPPGKLLDKASGREFGLKIGENTVGRQDADVLLTDTTVSRKHAVLTIADGKATLADAGSSNGAFVNGQKVEPNQSVEVTDGAEIKFGSCVMTLSLEGVGGVEGVEGAPSPLAGEPCPELVEGGWGEGESESFNLQPSTFNSVEGVEPEAPKAIAKLIGIDDTAGEYAVVMGENTVGRRPENSIAISGDPYVSGSHAVIVADETGFHITDVGSSNGTFVNDNKLAPNEPADIHPGDEVILGKSKFRFEAES